MFAALYNLPSEYAAPHARILRIFFERSIVITGPSGRRGKYEICARKNGCGQHPVRNRRHHPERVLTHDGLTLPISEWAERIGLAKATIAKRLRNGWTIAEALDPTDMRGRSKNITATTDRAEAA